MEGDASSSSSVTSGMDRVNAATKSMQILQRTRRDLNIYLLALLTFSPVTIQGTYDSVKERFLGHVDPMLLIVLQGGLSVFMLMFIWYIARRLDAVNERLDSSRHIETIFHAMYTEHQQTRREVGALRTMLREFQDAFQATEGPMVAYSVQ